MDVLGRHQSPLRSGIQAAVEPRREAVRVSIAAAQLGDAAPVRIELENGQAVVVVAADGECYAFDDRCPHRGARLSDGSYAASVLTCPLHHFRFDVKSGRCLMPKHLRLRPHRVTRDGDTLQIDVAPPPQIAGGDAPAADASSR